VIQIPKTKPIRSEPFLKYIRLKPCEVWGCSGKSVAAHVRKIFWQAGVGIKPHDLVAISLCDGLDISHHKELDAIGMEAFEERYNIDIKRIIINNLMEWINIKHGTKVEKL